MIKKHSTTERPKALCYNKVKAHHNRSHFNQNNPTQPIKNMLK
ncbi:hypothetical protein PTUN_b0349 [Pseudoalteromonas tunicata]|nr:hypothetical protein PTUN_b0349 [Pseudoalteromonas tunicata]